MTMANKPILYYAEHSPSCRAVLLTAAEIGIDLDLRRVNLGRKESFPLDFRQTNPQCTIPTLNDNGIINTESHVICMYLADKYSTNEHLFPKETNARNLILTRLFFSSGHLSARLRKIIEPIVAYGSTELWNEAVQYVKKSYDGLELYLSEYPYVCGPHMTIADLCCIAQLSSAHNFAPVDPNKFSHLPAWMERMAQLPYYQQCNQYGVDRLKVAVMGKLEENQRAWV